MDLDSVYRAEYGRCVATLTRILGDIGLAEEAVQDAFTVAVAEMGGRAAAQPRRMDRDHCPKPSDRPPTPRVHPGGPPRASVAAATTQRADGGGPSARRPATHDLHLLPPRAVATSANRANAAPTGRPGSPRDSEGLPGPGINHLPANSPSKKEDPRRRHPLPSTQRGRPPRSPDTSASSPLPGLQRGLHINIGGTGAHRPVPRGGPPGKSPRRPNARRTRGNRPTGTTPTHRSPPPSASKPIRRTGGASGAEPITVEPRTNRRGPHPGAAMPTPRPTRPIPDTGGDQRRTHGWPRHRLETGTSAIRPTAGNKPQPQSWHSTAQ